MEGKKQWLHSQSYVLKWYHPLFPYFRYWLRVEEPFVKELDVGAIAAARDASAAKLVAELTQWKMDRLAPSEVAAKPATRQRRGSTAAAR